MSNIKTQYKGLFADLAAINRIYGGLWSIGCSPYLHAAILISLICAPFWMVPGWWDLPISVLPNLVGFTLGGYAILLAFGDEGFKIALSGSSSDKASPYLGASATFAHFISVQILALILAIIAKSGVFTYFPCQLADKINNIVDLDALTHVVWGLCFTVFTYALTLLGAATIAIFHLTGWYDRLISEKQKRNKKTAPDNEN